MVVLTFGQMANEQPPNLTALLAALPRQVALADVTERARLDERIAAVGLLHANTIGVSRGTLQFCPDNQPPLLEEQLTWLWAIYPPLGREILTYPLSAACRLLLRAYLADELECFWNYMSQPGESALAI